MGPTRHLLPLTLALLACASAHKDVLASSGSTIDVSSLTQGSQTAPGLARQTAAGSSRIANCCNSSSTWQISDFQSEARNIGGNSTAAQGSTAFALTLPADNRNTADTSQVKVNSSTGGNSSNGPPGASCIHNPSQDDCSTYTYTRRAAASDLTAICRVKAYLSGCSLFRLCNQGVDPVSIGKAPTTCDDFELLATICGLDSLAADEAGCASYRSLCRTNQTVVQQCHTSSGLQHLVPTAAARQLSRIMCEGPGSPDTCKRCDWSTDTPACDFISIYGALCADKRGSNECSVWHKMCSTDPSLYVCREQLPGGRPGPAAAATSFGPAAPSPAPLWTPSAAALSGGHHMMLASAAAAAAVLLL